MQNISIIVPAHNEEKRIKAMLNEYIHYFAAKKIAVEFIIVLNGCSDSTLSVVREIKKQHSSVRIIDEPRAGKGRAVKLGFLDALERDNWLIGFIDADMATRPEQCEQLIQQVGDYDGIIASRYMSDAQVYPPRPPIKKWGRIIIYNSLIKLLFNMWYKDLQCGAKFFKRHVVSVVAPQLTVMQWAFDVELLYLCKYNGFRIKEVPTVWYDQDGSKLQLFGSGLRMLVSVIHLRVIHSPLRWFLK